MDCCVLIFPLLNVEGEAEISKLHVNYLCVQSAVVNGGARILKAVNYYEFYCTDCGCSRRPHRLWRVT